MDINIKKNGSVLLTITLLVCRNWFHSSFAADGSDGNGLKVEKNSLFLQVPLMYTAVLTKVVQKSVKVYATMPKGSLGNTQ